MTPMENARRQREWQNKRGALAHIAEQLRQHDAKLFTLLQKKAEKCATAKRQRRKARAA